MRIKVWVTNVLIDESCEKEHILELSENATLQELCETLGGYADVSDYYEFSRKFSWNLIICPFIITDNGIQYNVLYNNIKVLDFLNTHGIDDFTIHVKMGFPQAGGPGVKLLKEIWDAIEPILNDLAIISTLSGVNLKTILDYLRSFFENKKVPPQVVTDILSTRKQWNHYDLADLLGMPVDNTKDLLKTYGYVYDKQKMLYVPTELTEVIKGKIKTIQVSAVE